METGNSILSSANVHAWLECLPEDVRKAVSGEVDPSHDGPSRELEVGIMQVIGSGREAIVSVLDAHSSVVERMGRPRRMRLLSVLFRTPWPLPVDITRAIVSPRADPDGEADGGTEGGSGRGRGYPPIFREDLEAYAKVATSRIVRAASSTETVEAISAGIRSSDGTMGAIQPGGM